MLLHVTERHCGSFLGESGNYAASDASALLKATRNMIYLEEGDVAELTCNGYRIVQF